MKIFLVAALVIALLFGYNIEKYGIKVNLIYFFRKPKLRRLLAGLNNYWTLYDKYVKLKYKNNPNYRITTSDFNSFFSIAAINCYNDYIETSFKNLSDIHIDLLIKRRIYRVASYYENWSNHDGQIARDFMILLNDLNVRDEFKKDDINMKINEIDYSIPYP